MEKDYHIGIDYGVEGGDETCVVVRKGAEVRRLNPEDYEIRGNNLTLKVNPKDLFNTP